MNCTVPAAQQRAANMRLLTSAEGIPVLPWWEPVSSAAAVVLPLQ